MTIQKFVVGVGMVGLEGDELAEYLAEPSLEESKDQRVADVQSLVTTRMATGATVDIDGDTYHVAVTDGSRADIGSMATNAIATMVTGGAAPWLEAYILGWITIENVRKPLPTPADGLAFASAIASFYADTRQHGRTLKDAILAAADRTALDAIDIESGWPG